MGQPASTIAGQLASTPLKFDVAKYNAEASAAMRFGIFVKAATGADADRGAKLLTAVSERPIGVVGHHHNYDRTTELDSATGGVVPNVDLSLRMLGVVSVRVEGDIKFGDRAHVRAVSGAGGTVLGVARADAVSLETIDCSNLGIFIGPDDGGTTPERFAPFFVNTLSALTVPDAGSVDSEALAAGALSADATGRAVMATDYFNAATVLAKFGTDSIDATAAADIIQDLAILKGHLENAVQQRIHGTPTLTVGAESTDDISVTVQFKDINGDNMATPVGAQFWLSDTDVAAVGTAADALIATTGDVVDIRTAALNVIAVSNSSGVTVIKATKTGTSNRYLNCLVGGHLHRSAVMPFTT